MNITFEKNKELFTTFGIPAKARLFAEYNSFQELLAIVKTEEFRQSEYFHIGGGSNLIFMKDFDGVVLHSKIKGFIRYDKDEETAFAIVGSGEKWEDFVKWSISQNLQGPEPLAGIPGEVGAAAVQNIGAYGAEAADIIHNVECFDLLEHKTVVFSNEECKYGYRDSLFKNEGKGRYIIIRVSFRLKKTFSGAESACRNVPALDYISNPTIKNIFDEVLKLRESKLPNPELIKNAGSFFKNPVVHWYYFQEVVNPLCPDIPSYPTQNPYYVKVPAAWLIEHSNLLGYKIGGAQVYPRHALVIINNGNATPKDVKELKNHIIENVRDKFGIVLEPEVNMIDSSIEVTILGSGTSKGIPEIGCGCRVCRSSDSKDKRLRASALIKTMDVTFLIDASPDFRQQALVNNIYHADALLITHSHYDHVGGIDDLRPFCATSKFPVFLKEDVNRDLHRRIDYCFKDELYPGVPSFETHEIDSEPFYFRGVKIIPITVYHGSLPILGYRIGDFAYITDAKTIPENELEKLKGLKVLVLNSLRQRDHFAHLSVEEALAIIDKIKPGKTYLTHFCHEIGLHDDFARSLPDNIYPSYDGLKIEIT